MCEVTRIAEK